MVGTRKSNRREEILQALAQMLESTEGALLPPYSEGEHKRRALPKNPRRF